MKICNIIEEGRLGGPQIRIAEVAKDLKKHNVDTTVVYPKYQSDAFKRKLYEYNVKAVCLPLHKITKEIKHLIKYIIYFFFELILLYRFFKKENFDIIHCSGGSWQYKGIIAGKLAGSKTLWHLNDTEMPLFIRFIFKFIALYFADSIIVAGKRVKTFYVDELGLRKKSVFEIQAPVDTMHFNPKLAEPDEKLSRYDGIKIIMVGNLNPKKGAEYFIQMAYNLNKLYDNLHFFIVGLHLKSQKAYLEKLNNLKNDLCLQNVIFYGASHDVRSVLKASDIYVCSSIAEASPMSVWEAMSMGKAVVSTDVGDVSCFIKNNVNGFIVPIKDADSLADKVNILIIRRELRKNFGKKARESVRKYLDIKIAVKKHVDAYRSATSLSKKGHS
jgi:glycosyltransferase involved in cell wall biosynthesis